MGLLAIELLNVKAAKACDETFTLHYTERIFIGLCKYFFPFGPIVLRYYYSGK